MELRLPWKSLTLLDFIFIAEGFRGSYETIFFDGDKQEVVVINPTPELVKKLRKRFGL